ncbi:hypothetical protein NPIL_454641 [Nephila pilipes]|uniref:Uncharacterized protein n=1 Tax=Nephila pilipes TaxID=299642 RepID=A0A8X6TZC3_NEPPI|nr:hypothetical protein NPIL_454641 [Nephila pilipes]
MSGCLNIMKCLGCKLEHFSVTYAFQADSARIKGAEVQLRSSTLHAQALNRKKPRTAVPQLLLNPRTILLEPDVVIFPPRIGNSDCFFYGNRLTTDVLLLGYEVRCLWIPHLSFTGG